MKRRCHAFVSTETAEETLNSLPEYFSRISGAGHKSVLDARSDPKLPDSVTRHLRPDEVDGRGHREGVIPNGWHIFVTIARSKAAEPFPRSGLCSGDRG